MAKSNGSRKNGNGKVEYSNFKGFSVISLPYNKHGFNFGKGKARVIMTHIEEVARFASDDGELNVVAELLAAFEKYCEERLESWKQVEIDNEGPVIAYMRRYGKIRKVCYSTAIDKGRTYSDSTEYEWARVPLYWKDNERGEPIDCMAAEIDRECFDGLGRFDAENLCQALTAYRVPIAPTKAEMLDEFLNQPTAFDLAAG